MNRSVSQPVLLASLLIGLSPLSSWAQQIRVEKVKGNKAVIEFSGNLVPGKTYNIGGGGSSSANSETSGSGSRQYVFGASLGFAAGTYEVSSLTSSGKHNDLSISTRFGWNFETFEIGPILSYRNIDSDYTSQHLSTISAGGFVDYNFTPNRPGEASLYGITGEGVFSSLTPKTGSSSTNTELFVGGFLKWFGLTDSTALRADLGYNYLKSTLSSSSGTLQGFVLRGGVAAYF